LNVNSNVFCVINCKEIQTQCSLQCFAAVGLETVWSSGL